MRDGAKQYIVIRYGVPNEYGFQVEAEIKPFDDLTPGWRFTPDEARYLAERFEELAAELEPAPPAEPDAATLRQQRDALEHELGLAKFCLKVACDGLRAIVNNDAQLDDALIAMRALETADLEGALKFSREYRDVVAAALARMEDADGE